jgi:hypothetical protein
MIEMSETCTIYPERSDYTENEIWKYYIIGEELQDPKEAST